MKRRSGLFWFALLLLLCSAAYLAVRLWPAKPTEIPAAPSLGPVGEVTALTIAHGDASLSFTKTADGWVYDGDAAFPVLPMAMTAVTQALSGLSAMRTVAGDVEQAAEYGLAPPSCIVTAVLANGDTYTLSIGAYNAYSDAYYASVDGKTVILIDDTLPKSCSASLMDYLDADTKPDIDDERVTSLTIEQEGKTLSLSRDTDGVWMADGAALDTGKTDELLHTVTGLYFYGCSNYHCTQDADRDQYGLWQPRAAVSVVYTDASDAEYRFVLYIGDDTADGYTYVSMLGSDMIFYAAASETARILDADAASLAA